MNYIKVLLAQALDNEAPDNIQYDGQTLSSDEKLKRGEAVLLVSEVVKRGKKIRDSEGVRLIVDDINRFVFEFPTGEKDCLGRTARILCCGIYDSTTDSMEMMIDQINTFAEKIGCNNKPGSKLVLALFNSLKKNNAVGNYSLL